MSGICTFFVCLLCNKHWFSWICLGWPCTQRDLLASASEVLGLKACYHHAQLESGQSISLYYPANQYLNVASFFKSFCLVVSGGSWIRSLVLSLYVGAELGALVVGCRRNLNNSDLGWFSNSLGWSPLRWKARLYFCSRNVELLGLFGAEENHDDAHDLGDLFFGVHFPVIDICILEASLPRIAPMTRRA